MSAIEPASEKIHYDRDGQPTEVVISYERYEKYQEFVEAYGLDLSDEENADLDEALADSRAGRREAFVSEDEV